ncbi:hypothetical protein I5G59_gp83 [Mycobacterium phage LilMcDreamy]|uniref:Uncharacterized protein n=1 Tax=Mycobacterium phage LilMcDreamy TaxID=2652422 RepID=A0A5P8D6N7_9CAUD|nr:hypothetical protein I5G59_gp83 [Mycobacterium phage LilMcDreamy]QFP94703.1 hypothetical protein SEA_LILMCDREAMY_83 [Mycobacterium phage LilMcDreamy]
MSRWLIVSYALNCVVLDTLLIVHLVNQGAI